LRHSIYSRNKDVLRYFIGYLRDLLANHWAIKWSVNLYTKLLVESLVLWQRNFRQNFTLKFPDNFGKKVWNFLTKLSRESFVEKFHPEHVKLWLNFCENIICDSYHIGLNIVSNQCQYHITCTQLDILPLK